MGQGPSEVFGPDDVEWYRELYERTLAGERGVALRDDMVDGQHRYFEVYANPIHSLEGVSGAVFFGKDVTQRFRAEEALRAAKEEAEAANKAKSDFLANMSHELRTPLNSVIGFTNILLKNKDERLNKKDLGFLQRVLANGKHLLALINEVLDLAKVEAGRMELIIEDVDLAHLCVETVQQLEGQAKAKDGTVQLIADVPDSVEVVRTDSAKLKQVIINLVGNALKFTHEGSVTVRLDLADDGHTPVAIAVQDTGIGIPEDRLGAIFEAFQQAEAGTSRKYGGTGLGLALSRSICLLMGYDLIVESTVGEGSTFKIVMGKRAERPERPSSPAATPADEGTVSGEAAQPEADATEPVPADPIDSATGGEAAPSSADPMPLVAAANGDPAERDEGGSPSTTPRWSEYKVLVVDDEPDTAALVAHFLKEFGCQVLTATSGEQALEIALEQQPDLMTLDLVMPGMTGWEVLNRMKSDARLKRIPVVVVSVLTNEGRGRLLGAVDIITKPFEREDLLRVVWRTLGRNRAGRVLLMVGDDLIRDELMAVVEGRGLSAVTETVESPLDAIVRHAPDAVVVDMVLPAVQGVASLLELRENRLHTGLPTLVLTHERMHMREQEIVEALSTLFADRERAAGALERLLESIFPVVGAVDGE